MTSFLYALETENHYFTQEFKKQTNSLNLSSTIFSLVTNIKLNDIPTLIKNELPGFSTYYSEIAVAGEGTNESNIPKEPNVSLEELTKQRNANLDATQKNNPKIQQIIFSKNPFSFTILIVENPFFPYSLVLLILMQHLAIK
ncbi:hypothetical protein AAHB54_30100 [Bacillus cereus]